MRRSMHSLIVAMLCLTLFVDSAKACWWLRQHRSRSQVCRPVACRPAAQPACGVVSDEPVAYETIFVDDQPDCLCSGAPAEHATVDHEVVNHETGEQVIDHHAGEASVLEQGVVVHGPTIVVDADPAQPAPAVPEPTSVVSAPKAEQPSPAAAQPMPVASSGPVVLPTPTPAQEPIPDLKPAIAPQSPVAQASNEQPMPEPAAALGKPGLEKPAEANQPVAPSTPMPVPVEALAGGPEVKPPRPEPKEPNLFDLYGDDVDDDAPAEEAPVDSRPEMADDDAGEPAEDSAAETTPADEAEMTEDEADATEADATEADSETAEEAAPAEEPAAEEADPAAAAVSVPNEPMRRWSNDTGTHHAQGWLVEVRSDRVRILKVNGRHTTVLTESLSAADRDYVSAVGDRLAAQQQGTSPAPITTAGL